MRKAVLIVDMQPKLLNLLRMSQRERLVENVKKVVKFADKRRIPVRYAEFIFDRYSDYERKDKASMTLSELGRKEFDGRVIYKYENDAFSGTLLPFLLRDIDVLVLAGIYTGLCIIDTLRGALRHGKEIVISLDTTADIDEERNYDSAEEFLKLERVTTYVEYREIMRELES